MAAAAGTRPRHEASYSVKRIKDRQEGRDGGFEYRVEYEGSYPDEWLPVEQLEDCRALIDEYEEAHARRRVLPDIREFLADKGAGEDKQGSKGWRDIRGFLYSQKKGEDKQGSEASKDSKDDDDKLERARGLLSAYPQDLQQYLQPSLAGVLGESHPGNVTYVPLQEEAVTEDGVTFFCAAWNRRAEKVIARGAKYGQGHVIIAVERSENGKKVRLSTVTVNMQTLMEEDPHKFDFASKAGRSHFHHGGPMPKNVQVAEISSEKSFMEKSAEWLQAYLNHLANLSTPVDPSEEESVSNQANRYNLRPKGSSARVRDRSDSDEVSEGGKAPKKAAKRAAKDEELVEKLQKQLEQAQKALEDAKKAPATPSTPAAAQVVVDTPMTQPTVAHTPMTRAIVPHVEPGDERGNFGGLISREDAEIRARLLVERARRRQLQEQLDEYEIKNLYRK